jgi:hypothetical protein
MRANRLASIAEFCTHALPTQRVCNETFHLIRAAAVAAGFNRHAACARVLLFLKSSVSHTR